jgi:hypothetical protein
LGTPLRTYPEHRHGNSDSDRQFTNETSIENGITFDWLHDKKTEKNHREKLVSAVQRANPNGHSVRFIAAYFSER